MPKSQKQKALDACSRYCRLRDAVEFCREHNIDMMQFSRPEDLPVQCCDCDHVGSWIYMDGGHFIGRGLGCGSGVVLDERNVHAQRKICNKHKQHPPEYEAFMVRKYGQEVVDELRLKHRTNRYDPNSFVAWQKYYQERYGELVKEIGF